MKRTQYIILFCFLLVLSVGIASAQDDNTVKLPIQMSIPPSASLSLANASTQLSPEQIRQTAQIIRPNSSSDTWINYSSVVEKSTTNSICVNIVSGDIPAEIAIKLKIGPEAGLGMGQVGKPSAPIYLSIHPQAIITNIGSCFTGLGVNKGHLLTYSWELQPGANFDLKSLEKENIEVAVTYTFSSDD